jgi:hypothetical protein
MHVSIARCIPRYEPVVIDTSGMVLKSPPRLVDYADDRIVQGILRGSYQIIEGNVRYVVTWYAADSLNSTIEEIQRPLE